jgi:hypothetical protein
MTTYALLTNVTAVQSAPTNVRGPMNSVAPHGTDNPNSPPTEQAFHLVVNGVDPVAATVQVVASNDGTNWINYGDPVTATSVGSAPAQASWGGTQPFRHFGAYVTAISGTSAAVNLKMSA